MPRLTPFELIFEPFTQETFPRIRPALEQAGDPRDRDAFLLQPEVAALLRELRPEEGLGTGIDELAALVHHAYLYWLGGRMMLALERPRLTELLATSPMQESGETASACYLQLPERQVWAELGTEAAAEPLDGCFLHYTPEGELRVLGVFGLRPERPGFTVAEVVGPRPKHLSRVDHTPLFSPTIPGGAAAGLHSLSGAEELLELGWRGLLLTRAGAAVAG